MARCGSGSAVGMAATEKIEARVKSVDVLWCPQLEPRSSLKKNHRFPAGKENVFFLINIVGSSGFDGVCFHYSYIFRTAKFLWGMELNPFEPC